jgi:tRNA A37 threonylcarbamoyladenosine synthetase subunit TsaC/SUA5/YrdC
VFLEGGILSASAPSTVIACDARGYRIIRAGAITENDLIAALGNGTIE